MGGGKEKMPSFESGVASYIKAYAVVEVYFPVDYKGNADISCKQCPYLSSGGRICQLNKKIVAYPEKNVGQECPLDRIERRKE